MRSSEDPNEPHPTRAERASSFARVAHEYQRGRPGYPREAIQWLLGSEPLEVLDLGAGTGKLSGALLDAGHHVIAVEPLDEMRAILTSRLPQVHAVDGTAEQLPLADASVDAVAVGAAFHWFDQTLALTEISRVLRTPGALCLLGNSFDTTTQWVARVREVLGPPALERRGHWPSAKALGEESFVDVEEHEFTHQQEIDRASLRDLASSRSSLAIMSKSERETVLAKLELLWEREPELAGHTHVLLPWRTRVRRCRSLR